VEVSPDLITRHVGGARLFHACRFLIVVFFPTAQNVERDPEDAMSHPLGCTCRISVKLILFEAPLLVSTQRPDYTAPFFGITQWKPFLYYPRFAAVL